MREYSRIRRLLVTLALLFGITVVFAPSASACVAGEDFLGVSPTGPIKVSSTAYTVGENLYTVPQWYGYGAPAITNWYIENDKGVINPDGGLCSTTGDWGGVFNLAIPRFITGLAATLLDWDYSLLDAATTTNETVASIQENIKTFINSGPYKNLYNVFAIIVILVGIVTVALLVFTQDQRDRSGLMRTLMSGGSVRSRQSAAIKEVGWIVLSVVIFGGIVAGLPYTVQTLVNSIASDFSRALQVELENFTREGSGNAATASDENICATTSQNGLNTSGQGGAIWSDEYIALMNDQNSVVKCNLYRIYEWTPWVAIQFGGTNAADYALDPASPVIAESAELQKAIEQTKAKFGESKSMLVPYLQMQILQGNNNEAYNGAEMTPSERVQAFRSLGEAIDTSPQSQSWAVHWAGQGTAQYQRLVNAIATLAFSVGASFYVAVMALAQLLAIYAAAILPIFGLFFAVLIGMRQTRKKGMKILKWWLYAILLPPLVTLALGISLSISLIITGFLDFGGMGLFIYLLLSSITFVGTLIYMIWLMRKSKKAVDTVDGTQDEPSTIARVAGAAAPVVGSMIAPGIGGAIGGAVGATIAGGGGDASSAAEEPRPEIEAGSGDGEPAAGPRSIGPAPAAVGRALAAEPRAARPASNDDDDEIIDAEIIEEYDTPNGRRVIEGRPIETSNTGWGGEEPRVGPRVDEQRAIGSGTTSSDQPTDSGDTSDFQSGDGARVIQDVTDAGVRRIVDVTNAASIFIDDAATQRTEEMMGSAEEAAQAFVDAASKAASEHGETITGMHGQYNEQIQAQMGEGISQVQAASAEGTKQVAEAGEGERSRLFRSSSTAKEDLQKATEGASKGAAEANAAQKGLEGAAAGVHAAADSMEWAARDAEETADKLIDSANATESANKELRENK